MNITKRLFIITAISLLALCLCACSRNSNRAIDRAVGMGENAIDRGIGSIGDGIENSADIVTGRGADSGYSGFTGGTGSSMAGGNSTVAQSGRPMELLPTLGDRSRDNMGQVNTTNGSADGGMGDMYDDMDRSRNSLRTDTFNMNKSK